jgi:hypothetical protein
LGQLLFFSVLAWIFRNNRIKEKSDSPSESSKIGKSKIGSMRFWPERRVGDIVIPWWMLVLLILIWTMPFYSEFIHL